MIHYVLFCVLWAKPQTQLFEIPVGEYGIANMEQDFGAFHFQADIIEERMNSVKITHKSTNFSTQANSSVDLQQRGLYVKLDLGPDEASLDCEMREKAEK